MKGWIMIHKIKAMHDEGNGNSIKEISRALGLSRNTVRKYLRMNEQTIQEYLDLYTDEEDAMSSIVGASITYRLAFGSNAGKMALTLQTLPATFELGIHYEQVSKRAGFSLHAGVACKASQRKKLERICRYLTRPAIAEQHLSLAGNGSVVVAAKSQGEEVKPRKKAYSMTWAQRLKRVFAIEIEKCDGRVRIIACIEDPEVIEKILKHLGLDQASRTHNQSPSDRVD